MGITICLKCVKSRVFSFNRVTKHIAKHKNLSRFFMKILTSKWVWRQIEGRDLANWEEEIGKFLPSICRQTRRYLQAPVNQPFTKPSLNHPILSNIFTNFHRLVTHPKPTTFKQPTYEPKSPSPFSKFQGALEIYSFICLSPLFFQGSFFF